MTKFRGLDRLIRTGVLHNIQMLEEGISDPRLLDRLIDEDESGKTKNVCANPSIELAGQVDEAVSLLGCSKRRFIESAIIAALQRVEEIKDEEHFDEVLENSPYVTMEAASA